MKAENGAGGRWWPRERSDGPMADPAVLRDGFTPGGDDFSVVSSQTSRRTALMGLPEHVAVERALSEFRCGRPVIMTAVAMLAGMIPMAMGWGEGGEQNAPLGRAVIGGLMFATAATLSAIPGVEAFEILRETSPKNEFSFGISMEFADGDAYEGYNGHPDHVAFVQRRWIPEVTDFLEIDYIAS